MYVVVRNPGQPAQIAQLPPKWTTSHAAAHAIGGCIQDVTAALPPMPVKGRVFADDAGLLKRLGHCCYGVVGTVVAGHRRGGRRWTLEQAEQVADWLDQGA